MTSLPPQASADPATGSHSAAAAEGSGLRALILCAGEGTRLRPLTLTRPKALVEVAGIPLVTHLLVWLHGFGITEVAINLHYLPNVIPNMLGDGSRFGVQLTYSYEPEIRGTAGAARELFPWFTDTFLVVYGDILTDVDISRLIALHRRRQALATIGLVEVDDPTRAGVVITNGNGRVLKFIEKPTANEVRRLERRYGPLRANGGIYVLQRSALTAIPASGAFDFGQDLFPSLLRDGASVYAFPMDGYLQDIGSLERLAVAESDARNGLVRLTTLP